MGKLAGILPISGTVGNLCFASTRRGIVVRKPTSLSAARVASDPAFCRTRENSREFGRAVKAAALLRRAFLPLILDTADSRVIDRLISGMHAVMKTDSVHVRGMREVGAGDLSLLKGFEFNKYSSLKNIFLAELRPAIANGKFSVHIESFVPAVSLRAPREASHFNIRMGGVSIDFGSMESEMASSETGMLPMGAAFTGDMILSAHLTGMTLPMFLSAGVVFYKEVNGAFRLLDNRVFNVHSILEVVY